MTWRLLKEAGIDYASLPSARSRQRLCLPTYAARSPDGTYVISEERGIEKLVPFRFECRTIRVDQDGHTLYDSRIQGIDDGFGCLMPDGYLAIVRRTQWEMLIISPQGEIEARFGLENFSKRIPRYAAWTDKGTFLVVFFNRSFELDVVEIDRQGRLLWYLPPESESLGIISSVQLLSADTLLVADSFRHVACEIDRDGQIVWQFGETENPSSHPQRLSSPNSARCLGNGQRLMADTRNHRILLVGRDGMTEEIRLPSSGLCDPTYAEPLPDGHYLICDTGNGRVVELDTDGRIVWEFGDTTAARRQLSYPRSVDLTGPNRYLVADTGNNRIVEFQGEEVQEKCFRAEHPLFWPRCVRALESGTLLVADARNGRIVEISPDGDVLNQLRHLQLDNQRALEDPHDVRLLPNGHLLISDSPQDLVLEVDWSGRVYRLIGDRQSLRLKDPHSAQQLPDGSIVISDTGHHRILIVGPDGNCIQQIQAVRDGAALLRLHHPRYAEATDEGTLVIADTGQNRILGTTLTGELLWQFRDVPDSKLTRLNQPRWAKLVGPDEIVVCDHFNHRVLHAKWCRSREVTS